MTLSAAERLRRALVRANRPAPRTDAERAQAYRARKRSKRDALVAEAARIAEHLLRQELTAAAERRSLRLEIERREREAEHAERARRIASGELSPDGDPWRPGEPVVRPNTPTPVRAMMEAGRQAAVQQAVDQFMKNGALLPDPFGPRSRPVSLRRPTWKPGWSRDY